ncbi:NUDIX domain-containing protein [Flagellimonas olearia]|uniref:NUDIX domain-containing protein n=1 Tax=Flagellimonas olearia TaxID=552546 RepID=A0A6I1E4B9_9FLAO|nr:NUDIX hydrolase [Allomuricauda olearia]KAB7528416.1 NUDIX domain-containing protein [Allomuricauda olearia]
MDSKAQLNLVKRIKAISETGLVYAQDPYDRERYEELKVISLQLMAQLGNVPMEVLKDFFLPQDDYPTPKVDVRAFVLNEKDEILMARESIDGKWTIPGGWADIGSTPSETAVKEVKEETGIEVEAIRLLAVYDKQTHPHPPAPIYVYKLIFLCQMKGGELKAGFDMLDAGFFPLDQLPELSEERILEEQIIALFKNAKSMESKVYFD